MSNFSRFWKEGNEKIEIEEVRKIVERKKVERRPPNVFQIICQKKIVHKLNEI